MRNWKSQTLCLVLLGGLVSQVNSSGFADEVSIPSKFNLRLLKDPTAYQALKNPQCSYCNAQHEKGFVRDDDRVLAWLRSSHDGGAIPIRHFLAATRVINDTYGIFFYDPDGGYVSSFERSRGYKHVYSFHGWRNGVMVVKGNDGSLVSALSGEIFAGPRKGQRLKRIPSLLTNWKHWIGLHPKSVAYRMYDGKKFVPVDLPTARSKGSLESTKNVDKRIDPMTNVLGVTVKNKSKAWPVGKLKGRHVFNDQVADKSVAVFWDGDSQSAVAFSSKLTDRQLTFKVDDDTNAKAPFRDVETGSRWTLAGRAVDGPLSGSELDWVNSLQSRWFAWAAEFPETSIQSASN